jgi:pyruvate/2-oxoglutarate dehydrogenase complex dihydrolipoamide dehydrogenase (E3) component
LVVAGGGTVGCETALFLASQNCKVIIVEMLESIALDMEPINRIDLLVHLEKSGIEVLLRKTLKKVTEEGVLLSDQGSREELIRTDWVVWALGAKSDNALFKELSGKVPELYVIGNSSRVGNISDAIYDGFRVARLI